MEQSMEIFGAVTKTFYMADDAARAAAWTAFETEGAAKIAAPLAARLAANGGFLVGSKLTAADVCLFANLHLMVRSGADTAPVFAALPTLQTLYDNVMATGGLKAHCDLNLTAYYTKK